MLPTRLGSILCLALAAASPMPAVAQQRPQQSNMVQNPIAEFAGLDKITGRIIRFDVRINETVQFGALQVTPRGCFTRRVTDQPQTTGFVEVNEITLRNEIRRIFSGWMFAASPGLNAVEHPIYDVWLADCKGTAQQMPERGPQAGFESDQEPAPAATAPQQQRRSPPPRPQQQQQQRPANPAGAPTPLR